MAQFTITFNIPDNKQAEIINELAKYFAYDEEKEERTKVVFIQDSIKEYVKNAWKSQQQRSIQAQADTDMSNVSDDIT